MEKHPTGRVVILHGWFNGDVAGIPEYLPDSEKNWMGWTKKELEKRGYTVVSPFIRFGFQSEYEDWKREIEKIPINENTTLVGWSSGGAFWVRWLSETKRSIKKLVLLAPAKVVGNSDKSLAEIAALPLNPEWRPQWERFHDFVCDPDFKNRVGEIVIFTSDDAPWLIEAAEIYAKELNAELIKIPNQGHFENSRRPSPEFLELLAVILR